MYIDKQMLPESVADPAREGGQELSQEENADVAKRRCASKVNIYTTRGLWSGVWGPGPFTFNLYMLKNDIPSEPRREILLT